MVRLIDQLLVGAWAKMSNLGARVMHDAAIYAGMDFSTPCTVNRSMGKPGLMRFWLEKRSKGGESSHPLQDAAETAGKVAWCCCSPHRHIGGPRNFPPPLLPRNVPAPDGPCVPVVPDDLHSSLKKPPDLVGIAWAKHQFFVSLCAPGGGEPNPLCPSRGPLRDCRLARDLSWGPVPGMPHPAAHAN